jgi:hypothetical protein
MMGWVLLLMQQISQLTPAHRLTLMQKGMLEVLPVERAVDPVVVEQVIKVVEVVTEAQEERETLVLPG